MLTAQEQAGLVATALHTITPEDNGTGSAPEANAGALTAQQAMTVVRYDCAAYNCEYDVVSRQRQAPYAQTPMHLEPLPLGIEPLQGSVGYDPASGTLSYFYKLRGLGDCGAGAVWVFDGQGFQLSELHAMPRCTGVGYGDWPALWSTAPAP